MLTRIMDCLETGVSYSQDDLARVLEINSETVMAGIAHLSHLGYIKPVVVEGGCAGSCKGCPGCGSGVRKLPLYWKRVK